MCDQRDRADQAEGKTACEMGLGELVNHWGWGWGVNP